MSWTYSTTLTAAKDQVRLLIGDVDTMDQQLQDEEITYLLTLEGTTYLAAATAAQALAFKYARKADTQVGDVRKASSAISKQYATLAKGLRAQAAANSNLVPYCGGITDTDKDLDESDTDVIKPFFSRTLHDATDNVGAGGAFGPSQADR